MHGKVVLVCTDRTRTWRSVTPPLAGAGNQLVHAEDNQRAADLLCTGAIDLAVVEWPSGIDLDPVLEAAAGRAPVVVLVGETGMRALEELVCRRGLMHLCAGRPEQEQSAPRAVDPVELVVTCEKILRRDIFGLDKYLAGFGIERPSRVVTHADERDATVAELAETARALGAGRRIIESVSLVGDELFTNAVYNAPRDADGRPRYAHVSRREKIALEPSEQVRVEFGSDGRTFGLSVSDRFGALAPDVLRRGIQRCVSRPDPIEQKPGGAGIGLYAALCHADHMVFNLQPGARTEVIALWSLSRKSGGRGAGIASLHVFEGDGRSARDGESADGAPRVRLSESAKSEIFSALIEDTGARVLPAPHAEGDGGGPGPADTAELVAMADAGPDPAAPAEDAAIAPAEEAAAEQGGASKAAGLADAPMPPWLGPITCLRGVQILRRADGPALEAALSRVREAPALADAVEALMTYLVGHWTAAMLLCRIGDTLVPWTAAGDVDGWEELCEMEVPLAPGWLRARSLSPGVTLAPLGEDPSARRLGDSLTLPSVDQGLALSFVLDQAVLVVFACRPGPSGSGADAADYEELQRELSELTARVDRSSRLPAARRPPARASL